MIKKTFIFFAVFIIGGITAFAAIDAYRSQKASDEYASRPAMPVDISYRIAIFGDGLVAIFKNNSDRSLAVLAKFTNPTLRQEKSYRIDIPANYSTEFGYAEGWPFASGDSISLYHNDYKTLIARIP